jgi:hypothetical protein
MAEDGQVLEDAEVLEEGDSTETPVAWADLVAEEVTVCETRDAD